MRNRLLRAALVLLLTGVTIDLQRTQAQDKLPAALAHLATGGAAVQVLAEAEVSVVPDQGTALTLSRITPPSSDELSLLIMGGPELWYVESGSVVVAVDGGATVEIAEGESALIPGTGQLSIALSGEQCPSALRLELTAVIAMKIASEEEAPALGPDGQPLCPPGGVLFEAGQNSSLRPDPALAVIARVDWTTDSFVGPGTFSGPVGYAVESGRLLVSGLPSADMGVEPGSWITVAGGQEHWTTLVGTEPASAIVAGAFTLSDGTVAAPTPTVLAGVAGNTYTSPSYGYGLSWDPAWSVQAESSVAGSDYLQLSNGVSNVYLQADPFIGDAVACLQGIVDAMPGRDGFANVRYGLTADGEEIVSGDGARRFAIIQFDYTSQSGTAAYTEYVECRALPGAGAMIVVTHIVTSDAFPAERDAFNALLETLRLPGS